MSEERLVDSLKQLSTKIMKEIDEALLKGTIRPQNEMYFRWKAEKFNYSDKGVTQLGLSRESFTKPSWLLTTIGISESTRNVPEYAFALESLKDVFGKSGSIQFNLDHFVLSLILRHLTSSASGRTNADSMIATFLKDLREEPMKQGADVELQGIALDPEVVEPAVGVSIRKTRIEDLEKVYPADGITSVDFMANPSAIMHIELRGRGSEEIQKGVERAVTILRLFKVGSISWLSYRMYTESITDLGSSAVLTAGQKYTTYETCVIRQEDVQRLRKFWQTIGNSLPSGSFEPLSTKVDYLGIAYKRYSDALLENGLIERQIANAVMGLEAIFLKPVETQELPYRLSLRIGKTLAPLGRNPVEIRRAIADAYKVRNLFVHGGQLGYERTKKLQSEYRDIRNLLLMILDYLRISLVVAVRAAKGKNEFVDLIDDSLVDKEREQALNNLVGGTKDLIG